MNTDQETNYDFATEEEAANPEAPTQETREPEKSFDELMQEIQEMAEEVRHTDQSIGKITEAVRLEVRLKNGTYVVLFLEHYADLFSDFIESAQAHMRIRGQELRKHKKALLDELLAFEEKESTP